eukprot:1732687-Amphidinium_carterae.1
MAAPQAMLELAQIWGEVRYEVADTEAVPYDLPAGAPSKRVCVKNNLSGEKRFEVARDSPLVPNPLLILDVDESSCNLAAIQFLQHRCKLRLLHYRDGAHRCWNDFKQALKDAQLTSRSVALAAILETNTGELRPALQAQRLQQRFVSGTASKTGSRLAG